MMRKSFSKISLILVVVLFCSTAFLFRPCLSVCNAADKKVLLEIKQALGNPDRLASWNPNTDCCEWGYDVECDDNNDRVVTLHFFVANISGQIPPQVGKLSHLRFLSFDHVSNITGTIPSSIFGLKRLTILRLKYLNLSGPIPDLFDKLPKLYDLDLSFNQFTGSLPSSFYKLKRLGGINFNGNQLTGTIPETYGKLVATNIHLSHNKLSGTIPASLGNMSFLNGISLSNNKLEGDASILFGKNKNWGFVDISRNKFAFDLGKVEPSSELMGLYLDISHNKIYGKISAAFTNLTNLNFLNASYNRLCGQIPVGGNLQTFDKSTYSHNKCLCGSPLPACK